MKFSNEINRAVLRGGLAGCALLVVTVATSYAQQTTGTPGAPDATTTIDGKYLPPPPPRFGGTINLGGQRFQTVLAAEGGAAQGRAQHLADHDR